MQARATAAAIDRALDRIGAEGRRAHGTLGPDANVLRAGLREDLLARLGGLGLVEAPGAAEDLLSRIDGAGLYLAAACEAGREGAWEVLTRTYTPRLTGLAVRRGMAPSEAAGLVDELMGALALPPPRGTARTRMGTYLGAGSLFGWLATTLVRRIADRARSRRTTSLEADPETAENVSARRGTGPLPAAIHRENAEDVADALTGAWSRLTTRERLALALKYRDGLTQRSVARVLGVGEPRVSRLVHRALEKIEGPLRAAAGTIEDHQWPGLRDAVQGRLAILAAGLRPSPEGLQPTGEAHAP